MIWTLIRKGALAAAPFAALAAVVAWIDPYCYFGYFNFSPPQAKYERVYPLNPVLWDVVDFQHGPCANLIMGDSRAQTISLEHLAARTGRPHKRLSATAAKINEIVDYFWFATSRTKLDTVYIVLNFNMFNHYAFADRVRGAVAAMDNPFLYVFSGSVLESTWLVLQSRVNPADPRLKRQERDKARHWTWTLENWAPQQYGKWKYPERDYQRLLEIDAYCAARRIDLVVIVAPHHADYQARVRQFGLQEEHERFNRDIAAIGRAFDFDYANALTANRDNFDDPVHANEATWNRMLEEVLTGRFEFGRPLGTDRRAESHGAGTARPLSGPLPEAGLSFSGQPAASATVRAASVR